MTLDHIVYGVHDLEAGAAAIESLVGVAPTYGGSHVGLGTANYLCALGDGAYLEIIGPDPEQSSPERPRPFGLDHMMTAGVITWCARTDDLAGFVARAAAAGYEYDDPTPMRRDSPGGELTWELTFPRFDTHGGIVPFVIDWGDTPHPAGSAAGGLRLLSVAGSHPAPPRVRAVLDALGIDLEVKRAPEEGLAVRVAGPGGDLTLRIASFLQTGLDPS